MRVIAGRLRSRRLRTPAGPDVRPTSDRARAGLFDWLGPLPGGPVLDLYAGSGALGIEALSRGCESAVFVERSRPALEALRGNLAALGLEEVARVLVLDVRPALARLAAEGERFGLVLADPPYGRGLPGKLGAGDELSLLLAPGGIFVAERSIRDPRCAVQGLVYRASRTYGETAFDRFTRPEEDT